MKYATYDPATGAIDAIVTTSRGIFVLPDDSTITDTSHYISGGATTARPTITVAADQEVEAGAAAVQIATALPANTTIYQNGTVVGLASGDVSFSPTTPGEVVFRFVPPFPYQEATTTVTVTEATP